QYGNSRHARNKSPKIKTLCLSRLAFGPPQNPLPANHGREKTQTPNPKTTTQPHTKQKKAHPNNQRKKNKITPAHTQHK
ncbi:hypothetical protein, partial [Neisseria sp. P0014.S006]|uniref:hypothetical protein n=1 Tax=Neisseria sp. P0014.S006 TaxID=3436752 RepID=UPI003F7DE9B3